MRGKVRAGQENPPYFLNRTFPLPKAPPCKVHCKSKSMSFKITLKVVKWLPPFDLYRLTIVSSVRNVSMKRFVVKTMTFVISKN